MYTVHLCSGNGKIEIIERMELDHGYAKAKMSVAGECEHGLNGKSGDSTTTSTTTIGISRYISLESLICNPSIRMPALAAIFLSYCTFLH